MNFKQLTDSIYIIPVLLDHLANPTPLTQTILRENGINWVDIDEFRKVEKLLRYHYQTVQTWKPDYTLLKQGLAQYFDEYLNHVFKMLGIVNEVWTVLDYGCGAGHLGLQFKRDNPLSDVFFLDRESEMPIKNFMGSRFISEDFEKSPNWYKFGYINSFNCALMSELLHCKDMKGQQYLVKSVHKILKPGGTFIIIENLDYCMEYRMKRLKQQDVSVVNPSYLACLLMNKFVIKNRIEILNHQIYVYEKI